MVHPACNSSMLPPGHNHTGLTGRPENLWYQCWDWPTILPVYLGVEVLNSLLGLTTNCWFLGLVAGGPEAQLTREMFSINLALLEILYCLFSPVHVANVILIFSQTLLSAWKYVFGLIIAGRPLFQCSICLERYLAVVHPVVFLRYKPMRYRLACCGLVWLLTILLSVGHGIHGSIALNCGIFTTLLFIDVFCCVSILLVLRRSGPGDGGRERKEGGVLMKKAATRTVLLILVTLLVNYSPVFIGAGLFEYIPNCLFQCVVSPVTFCFSVMGSFTQPLFYLRRVGKLTCLKG